MTDWTKTRVHRARTWVARLGPGSLDLERWKRVREKRLQALGQQDTKQHTSPLDAIADRIDQDDTGEARVTTAWSDGALVAVAEDPGFLSIYRCYNEPPFKVDRVMLQDRHLPVLLEALQRTKGAEGLLRAEEE